MPSEEREYIVKAKDANIEIKSNLKGVYIIIEIIMYIIMLLIMLLGMIFSNASIMEIVLVFSIITFSCLYAHLFIIAKYYWNFKIENKKIYIDKLMEHYEIDYSDLICFKYWKIHRKGYNNEYFSVNYLKNGEKRSVDIICGGKEFYKLTEIRKLFITNKDLENGVQIDNTFFDVRD